ncbi:alpha-tocopherol transfer protein-like isoform X2 [Mercenaria mercenaria]|nr:alpha-tocopherol transfer protein-like isoform X2 [Mercenaria mercenaria]XP_045214133.1 alpha-tocopherol transfer protein-like isoform X2 [Mercenaria mercenaria]XP_053393175.1 alpha-tocopherol transfer protein-like isoform X2 [Mercenaria mercenaria]
MMSAKEIRLSSMTEELRKVAEEEVNEQPARRHVDIETLRNRILLHPELKVQTDDAYLLRFLRATRFDHESAFTLIQKYLEMKSDEKNRLLFKDMRPSSVKHVLEAGVTGELPNRDKLGRRVMVFRPGKWDPSKFPITDMFKTNFMTLYKFIEDEETQIKGVVVIFDMNGMGFGQITHLSPFFAKRIVALLQESFPMQFKAVHLVNEPAVFDYLFAILRHFMSQETIDKMNVHGHKLEELAEYFDVDHLPAEYGGNGPKFSNEEWMETLLECDAEFDAEAKNCIIKTSPNDGSGTYRKLHT